MQQIMVVGGLNMDQTVWSDRMPEAGETILGEKFAQFYGGKGANQAVAAATVGGKVAMVGRVGNDAIGRQMCEHMAELGIDVQGVQPTDGVSSGVAVIFVDATAQNRIVVASGANDCLTADDVRAAFDKVGAPKVILAEIQVPYPAVACALSMGRACGAMTILNPTPVPEGEALEALKEYMLFADVIAPNETELAALTGMPVTDVDSAEQAARALLADHAFGVLVTLGDKGSLYVDDRKRIYMPPAPATPVDTTGAGDNYLGSLAAALAEGCTMEEAMRTAGVVSAMAVSRPGAQATPTPEELCAYADQHGIELPAAMRRGQIHAL